MKKSLLHIVVAVALSVPNILFAQAPNLGTSANFVIFSSNGAVTNTGNSHLTGNVGTNSGSNTGFGNVNGVMHSSNGTTSAAAANLLTAYNQLNTTTQTAVHAPLLGNGETLNAGVYAITGTSSLDQSLTLNAQGNADAVFIFKISDAFSTTASSQIILANGAQSCNVFWKVEGLVSLATSTIMRGTVIANNAAISIGTGVTLDGRALSTTGAISLNGVSAKIPNGCGSAVLTGPAAPPLGIATCYAIFSGNGSVTNSGTSNVTGDIGTNVGLTTGYNPLNVNGTIHPIPDGSTSACAADLLNAYSYLNTLAPDIELLFPAQFGSGLVLTPHTYIMNAATTFTDTLFLNAEGNTNAVFVIKINGALTTSTYATVTLMNGAQAGNVYWKVEGAVNINDFSNIKGSIVCNNGAINLKTGTILAGRALTTNGALSTASITAAMPAGCSSLPVTWLYFRGKFVQKNVLLEWGTTNEINNGFFTIEKSMDGLRFETLAHVNAIAGTAKAEYNYSFTDAKPYSVGYYRISQTDRDGQKNIFRTVQVRANTNQSFTALHYVQQNYIYVQASGATPGSGLLELYNIDGKKVSSQKIALSKDISTYKIANPLNKGMYMITIQSAGKKLYTGTVMVL